MRAWALSVAVFCGAGCQCLTPVEQCLSPGCSDGGEPDSGSHDAGLDDAGVDAGPGDGGLDAGTFDCRLWDGNGVGQCAAVTGYVFDGTVCRGECVIYPIASPGIFPTVSQCAHQCAIPFCNTSLLRAVLPQPFTPNAYCDNLEVDTPLTWLVEQAFPELDAGCFPDAGRCTLLQSQTLDDAGYLDACAATLLPETSSVTCWLYGP